MTTQLYVTEQIVTITETGDNSATLEMSSTGPQGARGPRGYQSDRIAFVIGSTNADPIVAGAKGAYLTCFDATTLSTVVLTADKETQVQLRLLASSPEDFPVFTPVLDVWLTGAYYTGPTNVVLDPMDILDLEVVSNTTATKLTLELRIAQ